MNKEKLLYEITFMREKLKACAVDLHEQDYISVSFKLGCLHSIACELEKKIEEENNGM